MATRSPAEDWIRWVTGWTIQSFQASSLLDLVSRMQGTAIPAFLPAPVVETYNFLVVAAVVTGAILCWRVSGPRRFVAIPVSALLLVAVFLSVRAHFADRRAELPVARLEAIKASDAYRSLDADLASSRKDLDELIRKTPGIPSDFTTEFRLNEESKEKLRKDIVDLRNTQSRMLESAQGPNPVVDTLAVSLFQGSSEVTFTCVFSGTLEVLALTLAWVPRRKELRSEFFPRPLWRFPWKTPVFHPEHLAYLSTAATLGNGILIAGYRQVARSLGISPSVARRQMEECQRMGYIRDRRLRVHLPEPYPPSAVE
jgi:hypothetical protein